MVVFSENAGIVRATRTAPAATAERTGRRRTRVRMAPQKRLSPSLLRSRCRNGIRPFSTLSPSLPSSAGQHGQRADHRDRDDHHRPDREGHERLVAGEEHAGHRDQHGDAGDEDGAAGGGCGGLEGGVLAASGGTLFALAPEVEERVVDADGEADQEDHLGDLLVDRDELARERDQARGRDDGGDREQQRDRARRRRSRRRAAGSRASAGARPCPAFASMLLNAASTALPVLALPSSSMSKPGMLGSGLVDAGDDRVDVGDRLVVVALGAEL